MGGANRLNNEDMWQPLL